MKKMRRSLLVMCSLVCWLFGLASWSAAASAEELVGGAPVELSASPLVIVGSPDESQQLQAGHVALLADPEVVAAREASQTKYEGLNPQDQAKVALAAYPSLNTLSGGTPSLQAGQHVKEYISDHAAVIDLPEGRAGLVEATEPIATGSGGRSVPIDLRLTDVGGVFEPTAPIAGLSLRIPSRLSDGVSLTSAGVSLTPVDEHGAALVGSEGSIVGTSVFYGSMGTDSAVTVQPTTFGFDLRTLIYSASAPEEFFYRVGLPVGASLAQESSGVVQVMDSGRATASIEPPYAQDAEGTQVPIELGVRGDVLTVRVAHHTGNYLYPLSLDPEVNDKQLVESGGKRSNWEFKTTSGGRFGHEPHGAGESGCPSKVVLETCGISEYAETEFAYWAYQTRGDSKIWEFNGKTEGKNKGAQIESFLELEGGGKPENKYTLSTELSKSEYGSEAAPALCAENGTKVECAPASGAEKNTARFQQSVQKKPSNYHFSDALTEGTVILSEPAGTHSTTGFNLGSSELEGEVLNAEGKKEKIKRVNVLNSGGWLSKYAGALEPLSEDKGIGVSATRLEYESSPGKWEQLSEHKYLETEDLCKGVQCESKQKEFWVLDPKLPNGEDKIRYRAEDAMPGTESLESEGVHIVKVDTARPHSVFIGGLPPGNELSERPYNLTIQATDGEGSTIASSGIKSIALYMDKSLIGIGGGTGGKEGTEGKCSIAKGECTATAKWTFNGAELGAGKHEIEVAVFDNAGNEKTHYEPISIHHSAPVAFGPGSVDLQSGDFTLGGTDVSMGSGLTVARNYSSRALEEGNEGPLGPQWNLNMGTTESLVELVDHSMMLTDGNGKQTIFAKTETTTYESPTGDSNLTLKLEENKETKAKEAFYLEDSADHTKVKFTLPSGGTKVWVPTRQEGAVSTDTVTYQYQTVEAKTEYSTPSESEPATITSGTEGNLWYIDHNTNKLGVMTTWGEPVAEYAAGGTAVGIAAGPEGNLWFTLKGSPNTFKITPAGQITYYGSGSGTPAAIAAGADGNMWFTAVNLSTYTAYIGKVTPSGVVTEYNLPKQEGAKSPLKVRAPGTITSGPDGNLWFTENSHASYPTIIGKVTTSGAFNEYTLPTGSIIEDITAGPGGLWFTNRGTNKIGKITTEGVITEYGPLPEKSEPQGVAQSPDGHIWFTEKGTNRIGVATAAGTIGEYPLPAGSKPSSVTAGADGQMWYTNQGTNTIGASPLSGTITRPTEALAPVPAKVECPTEKLKPGCRALRFTYYSESTAGENESEWGQYKGRLKQVLFVGYSPASKKMEEPGIPVAEYKYDKRGRLRAELDPRQSGSSETRYGYDNEGHITALDPAGQEPWTFTYGTVPADSGTGRLLKIARQPASRELWKGEVLKNTEVPTISGSAAVGVRMTVSEGSWSGGPSTYGFQWKDCNLAGTECKPILGATNQNYTPVSSDAGHTLMAQVTATNGGGSLSTRTSATVAVGFETQSVDNGNSINAVACAPATTDCVVSDSKGNAYYATNVSAGTVATWSSWSGPGPNPSEAVACPSSSLCLMAAGLSVRGAYGGTLYYTTSLGGSWTQIYKPTYGFDAISCSSTTFCVAGQNERGRFAYSTNPASTSWTVESEGPADVAGVFCLSSSFCAMANSIGTVSVATSTTQIESPLWTATSVDGTTLLHGIACTSTSSCVAVDEAGNVINLAIGSKGEATATTHNIDGTNSLNAVTCTGTICVTVDSHGNVFTSTNSGETWTNTYQLGTNLTSVSCSSTTLCVTADTNGNVTALNPPGTTGTEGELRSPQPGSTIDYNVPLEGSGAPAQMGINAETHKPEPEKWGQNEENDPVEATSIFPPDSSQGWPASSYTRATTYYLDEHGRAVNVANPSKSAYNAISTTEYNEENDVTRTLSPDNRITALEAGTKSVEVATTLSTFNTYKNKCSRESEFNEERESTEFGTRLCETEGPMHTVKYTEGKEQKEGLVRNHVRYFYDEKVPAGEPYSKETYNLVTEMKNLTEITNSKGGVEKEIEPRTTITSYSGQSNLGWKLRAPTSVTTDAQLEGQKLTHTTLYNEVTGQITETRAPKGASGNSAHDSKIIYYSSEENKEGYPGCGLHPEWSGLVCETLPAKQPETSGVPNLPVTETTYNMWNEPEKITETFAFTPHPTVTRTKNNTYDSAGRLTSSETTATGSEDKTLPKVTYEYEPKLGVVEKENTTVEGKTQTIASKYNTLGQLTEYTDANGNATKYRYYGSENDNSIQEVSDSSNEGKSKQTYSYDETTKQLTKLTDSAAETFTASYDAEGKMTSEIYPNGMCANYTHNSVGEATGLEYIKTTNCSESKPTVWFSENKGSSVRGETLSRTSTLANETYTYDTLGRLTEAQETPVGEGCSVRLYAYDEESNRTSSTSRKPGSKGECLTTGGTEEKHTYDEANRMTDTGIEYESLGNVTKLPAADAEGHELASTFYVDGAVATQSQHEVTNEYKLDPTGRVLDAISGGKETINHYDGAGEAVAWTCELVAGKCETTSKWTRNIPGIDGALAAVQTNGGTPVLQLHDLEGNVVATAELSSTATKLLSTYNSTEFGVPNAEKAPPTFAWLGASDVSKTLSSGVITYGATSYVPQTGLALQTEQVDTPGYPVAVGGGAPATFTEEAWVFQGAGREAAEAPGIGAAEQREAEEAACRANPDSCSEDPGWSSDVKINVARAIVVAMDALEIVYYAGDGKVLKTAIGIIAKDLGVDWKSQVEEAIERGVFGFSEDDVAQWAIKISTLLETCVLKSQRFANPHCWLYIPTTVRHLYRGGPGLTIPNFTASFGWENPKDIAVGLCPYGPFSRCYNQYDL